MTVMSSLANYTYFGPKEWHTQCHNLQTILSKLSVLAWDSVADASFRTLQLWRILNRDMCSDCSIRIFD